MTKTITEHATGCAGQSLPKLWLMTEKRVPTKVTDATGLTVAANVRRIRERKGLSTYQLATELKKVGRPIAASAIGKIERAERRVTVDELMALAVVLDINPSTLLFPPNDRGVDEIELLPEGAPDGGPLRFTAWKLWQWADGKEPLFVDLEHEAQSFLDFVRLARPPKRMVTETAEYMRKAVREAEEYGDGQSVD